MSYQFAISDIGLRLIKAYEGYVPGGFTTRDGFKVVGYGRMTDDQNLKVSEDVAEDMLKSDLKDIESLVNTHVHAALTQSQFDALCSLAHSIGAEAFLKSDILHALNRGEIISAANGFDGWRLGKIDGKIYVVDALVRRRTAEKALFLRPTVRTVPAPHNLVKPYRDASQTKERSPQTPKASAPNIVTLYERADDVAEPQEGHDTTDLDDPISVSEENQQAETYTSPIAEAAAEVSERLDALMDTQKPVDTQDWPDSLVETAAADESEITFNGEQTEDIVIDYLGEDDALRENISEKEYSSADQYIQRAKTGHQQNLWAYITMIIFGLTAAGGGLWASLKGAHSSLGEFGPLLSSAAVAIGVLLFLMGLYYLAKHVFGKS